MRSAATVALAALAFAIAGCKDEGKAEFGAVTLESGEFGAVMAASDGTLMLPVVERSPGGGITAAVGVVWMDTRGTPVSMRMDASTGLPTHLVVGDWVVVFRNWDTGTKKGDLALVYTPTGYVEVHRQVSAPIGVPPPPPDSGPGKAQSSLTCFPACPTKTQNLAEMLSVAGTALSIGGCVAASVGTFGAAVLPCAGALVSAAVLVAPEDLWLEDLENTGRILALTEALKCRAGNVLECVSFFTAAASDSLKVADALFQASAPTIAVAEQALANPAVPDGPVQGDRPTCAGAWECTPGSYLPCYPEGTKQCDQDCAWGPCPEKKPDDKPDGGEKCSMNAGMCECGTYMACITWSGTTCTKAWYKTSMGNFTCASCDNCTGAVTASVEACCPDDE